MSKTKTPMVHLLSLSLVFAFMAITIPTLATAQTFALSEPGVSLGEPLPGATLREFTGMGSGPVTITVTQSNTSNNGSNLQNNTAIITRVTTSGTTTILNSSVNTPNTTVINKVTVPFWFQKKM
jgi:hypothetical protein